MRSHILAVAVVSATALLAAAAVAPMATASSPVRASISKAPATALSVTTNSGAAASAVPVRAGKCETKFGTPIEPDGGGVISINNGSNLDVAGAADFTCGKRKKSRTFTTVTVSGFYTDPSSTQFNVTVYADKGGEPDNGSAPVCATQTATGTPIGSSFPSAVKAKIKLKTACRADKGTNWLEVQALTASAWYWETQQEVGGQYPADWRDATGALGTACTPGYQDGVYMQDCIFGGDVGQPDFMFTLR